ncbi:hypothetical protein [Methylocystis silviterrae]|nr:hypothetical protein [Methylocystis silviterrae]
MTPALSVPAAISGRIVSARAIATRQSASSAPSLSIRFATPSTY